MRVYLPTSQRQELKSYRWDLRQTAHRVIKYQRSKMRHQRPGQSDWNEPLDTYNHLRISQTPGKKSHDIRKDLERHEDIKWERSTLIRVMSSVADSDPWIMKQLNKVRSCRATIRFDEEGLTPHIHSCSNRWCGRCARKANIERTRHLNKAIAGATIELPESRYNWTFTTLTIDDRTLGVSADDVVTKVKAIRREITRMLNQRFVKRHIKASLYKIENVWSKVTGRANVHVHILCVYDCPKCDYTSWVSSYWKLGRILDHKRFRYEGMGSVMELTKPIASYLNKSFSYQTDEQLLRLIYAFRSVRASGATGVFRRLIAEVKEAEKRERLANEAVEPKQPPSQPSVVDMPFGTYDKTQLLYKILEGKQTAIWMLRWLEYYQSWSKSIGVKSGIDPGSKDGS